MRRLIGCALVGALGIGLALPADPPQPAETKDSFDTILKELICRIGELGDQLAKVTDEKTAKDAKKKLEETVAKMTALTERANKLKKDPEEAKKYDEKKLEEKYKIELEAATKKFSTEKDRLKEQPYGKEVLAVLKSKEKAPAPQSPVVPVAPPAKE